MALARFAFSVSRRTSIGCTLAPRLPVPEWTARRGCAGEAAATEEDAPKATKKRLSREERTEVVESFVRKYMAEKPGEFPSVSLVLKETGGSRPTVKEILAEVQTKFEKETGVPAEVQTVAEVSKVKEEVRTSRTVVKEIVVNQVKTQVEKEGSAGEETIAESTMVEKNVTAIAEKVDAEASSAKEKTVTNEEQSESKKTTWKMAGENPGEVKNVISGIVDRLRNLGPGEQLEAAEIKEKGEAETGEITGFSSRFSPPRHGMYVRFLPPSATNEDLKNAYSSCGDIHRVSAVKPLRPTAKFTYGFIDFKTAEGLSNAMRKSVTICGQKVETEAAPTHNTSAAPQPTFQRGNDTTQGSSPPRGGTLVDNLLSKFASMVPEEKPRGSGDTNRPQDFNRPQGFNRGGQGFNGPSREMRFRAGSVVPGERYPRFQKNDLPPKNETQQSTS